MLAHVFQSMEKNKAKLNTRQAYFNSYQKEWSLDGNSVLVEEKVWMPHVIQETLPISSLVHAEGNSKVKKYRGGGKRGGKNPENSIHSFEGELINS